MSEKINLWLDDERDAPEGWVRVTTADEAFALIQSGVVARASFDHDLGTEPTGYDLVKWCAEFGLWPDEKPTSHSGNPPGKAAILATIERYWNAPKYPDFPHHTHFECTCGDFRCGIRVDYHKGGKAGFAFRRERYGCEVVELEAADVARLAKMLAGMSK